MSWNKDLQPGTYYVVAQLPFKDAEDRDKAAAIIKDSIEKTPLNEPDCLHFNMTRSVDGDKENQPCYLTVIEIYRNVEAFMFHMKQSYVVENTNKVRPLFSGTPDVRRFVL